MDVTELKENDIVSAIDDDGTLRYLKFIRLVEEDGIFQGILLHPVPLTIQYGFEKHKDTGYSEMDGESMYVCNWPIKNLKEFIQSF